MAVSVSSAKHMERAGDRGRGADRQAGRNARLGGLVVCLQRTGVPCACCAAVTPRICTQERVAANERPAGG